MPANLHPTAANVLRAVTNVLRAAANLLPTADDAVFFAGDLLPASVRLPFSADNLGSVGPPDC